MALVLVGLAVIVLPRGRDEATRQG